MNLSFLMRSTQRTFLVMALAMLTSVHASAQNDEMQSSPTPPQPLAVPLNTGQLSGAKVTESWHSQYGSLFARNVTEAMLTPFLHQAAKATGAGVIVAPGGGFRTLSMQNEGWNVAKALAARGISAFVLKYRLNQTPESLVAFQRSMRTRRSSGAQPARDGFRAKSMASTLHPQLADAVAAFALVRRNSKAWKVDPNRIGIVGFSAGAMLAMVSALGSTEAKPAFVGNIYGPLDPVTVPPDAPPLFAALAADDPLFAGRGTGLIDSWLAARRPVEFHLYGQGGHGFGMYPKETTSTGWFEAFYEWLVMNGFTTPATPD